MTTHKHELIKLQKKGRKEKGRRKGRKEGERERERILQRQRSVKCKRSVKGFSSLEPAGCFSPSCLSTAKLV